jgi:hypothetical protein
VFLWVIVDGADNPLYAFKDKLFMLMRSALSQRWLVGMGGSEHIVKIVSSLLDTLVYRPPHPDQESMSSFVPKYAYTHVPLKI